MSDPIDQHSIDQPGPGGDQLHLRFPARSGYLGISRLNASAMAASAGFDVDELDDVRLAVGEAVAWLLADEGRGSVEINLSSQHGSIHLEATRTGLDIPDREPDDLVDAILGAVADGYATGRNDLGQRFVSLTIRRSLPAATTSDGEPSS